MDERERALKVSRRESAIRYDPADYWVWRETCSESIFYADFLPRVVL